MNDKKVNTLLLCS